MAIADAFLKEAEVVEPTDQTISKLIAAIDRVLPLASTWRDPDAVLATKLRGRCLENIGSLREALECYEKALAANPKAGVKQRADRIRKVLSAGHKLPSD